MTGLAMLSLGSMLAIAGISAGAWLSLAVQMRASEGGAANAAAAS